MIATYVDLKTNIANFMHRTDLDTMIPVFIQLAEAKISNNLIGKEQSTSVTITVTAGTNIIPLPTDFVSLNMIYVNSNPVSMLMLSDDKKLFTEAGNYTAGTPTIYTVFGSNIYVSPVPASTYTYTLKYQSDLIALSSINSTNWVLTQFPYIYLYGSLIEASIYTKDPEQVAFYQDKYNDAMTDILQKYEAERYSGGALKQSSDYLV